MNTISEDYIKEVILNKVSSFNTKKGYGGYTKSIINGIEEIRNTPGFQVDIDTLTGVIARITEQKFYKVNVADYLPLPIGENPFASELLFYRTFSLGGDFEEGTYKAGSAPSRTAQMETQIDSVKNPTLFWKGAIEYNVTELGQAQRAGSWSLIELKEKSRMLEWQLGLQRVAFLGVDSSGGTMNGLLNQPLATFGDPAIIPEFLSVMDPTEFQNFLARIQGEFFTTTNSTATFNKMVIPTTDYLGLANSVDETFPLKSRLQRLNESFQLITDNPNFKVQSSAYSIAVNNEIDGPSGKNRYAFYRDDVETLRMDIPIDFTQMNWDTLEGFNFYSVAYGQFSAVALLRPLEMLYFNAPTPA